MRKLAILAVVAILAIPAFAKADTANVTVYGTINTAIEGVTTGANAAGAFVPSGRMRLSSYSSNLGFKGTEEISANLKGIFQIELDLNMAEGSMVSTFRNSGIGLDLGCGKLIAGRWDTPYKTSASFADPFYGTVGYMNWDGGSTGHTRQAYSLNYMSRKYSGFGYQFYYSPKAQTGEVADSHMGGALTYGGEGALSGAFAYDVDSTTGATKTSAMKAALGYKFFDALSLSAGYASISEKSAADVLNAKVSNMLFSAAYKMGDYTLRGAYAMLGKVTTDIAALGEVANSNATQMSFGVGYGLSKRTELYTTYSAIANQEVAAYNFKLNPVNGSTGLPQGSDPSLLAVGVKHSF